jgi:hypothetical protein
LGRDAIVKDDYKGEGKQFGVPFKASCPVRVKQIAGSRQDPTDRMAATTES